MPIFAIFGHFLAIFGRFGPFLDREHQKQCNCNLLGATGPTNYINMVSNGYLEIWSVSDPKTNSGAKQDPKLTWGGQNWSFCTLCSPTNLFYTKNVNSEMVTSKSYFLAWNRPYALFTLCQTEKCNQCTPKLSVTAHILSPAFAFTHARIHMCAEYA